MISDRGKGSSLMGSFLFELNPKRAGIAANLKRDELAEEGISSALIDLERG